MKKLLLLGVLLVMGSMSYAGEARTEVNITAIVEPTAEVMVRQGAEVKYSGNPVQLELVFKGNHVREHHITTDKTVTMTDSDTKDIFNIPVEVNDSDQFVTLEGHDMTSVQSGRYTGSLPITVTYN